MVNNRSVPANVVLPHLYYEHMEEALNWLTRTFGFTEHYRFALPDGQLHGVMMVYGDAWIMLKSLGAHSASPASLGATTQSLMIFVSDVEAHYRQARSVGAMIAEELIETEYGEKHYAALDTEGHLWMFAQHIKDVHPTEWGASMASPLA
ncbi:VOC family protein [Paenibacillus montanisoli]|uniref:Glyoxalase/bleomycin resistance/extradiol dioxygenase family protein n=1 Tax=Paenibacillus montanisoli TaxID=2081970 RepID=A0A328TWL5_9BACL|nr:VOC family protein [Paenibacillus montanisoli]RAP73441.1 glyoxalase/bleomycin resistance/extradiol dioxygenase family protein [Paenibacillus montanisoli]